jgi:hypothetical protein
MKKMNRAARVFCLAGIIIVCAGCAHKEPAKESRYPEGKLYPASYDKVWDAVHTLIFTDLGCVEKKVNKKKGSMETEWVSQLSTEGTSRWRIKAQLQQKQDGTLVLLDKDVEQREVIDKNDTRAKEKSKDQNPNSGWRHNPDDSAAADTLYQQLENKLK